MMRLEKLIRDHITHLEPYHSARLENQGTGYTYLDANENPFGRKLNRYPDPLQQNVRGRIARAYSVDPSKIFVGNGSDEIIDLVIRAFVEPGRDNLVIPEPTYGMYEIAGKIHGAEIRKVPMDEGFQPDPEVILSRCDAHTKLLFLCSPNNPTGNLLEEERVERLLKGFQGIVVLDEAYIEFAGKPGMIRWLKQYPNLIIMRTFSKARGLAGIRLGYAFADPEIIGVLTRIKPPYNVNRLTQRMALRRMRRRRQVQKIIRLIREERARLSAFFENCPFVEKVYPSDANFLLVKVHDPKRLVRFLKVHGIIIRDRSDLPLCEGTVRITIGKPRENKRLMRFCKQYTTQKPGK